MNFRLAKSKAGHDKDQVYVIIREDRESVYLADGTYRPVENPKRKNKKHIQMIDKIPEEAEKLLARNSIPGNTEIKRILKLYQMRENSR